jgi:hypothetical protein
LIAACFFAGGVFHRLAGERELWLIDIAIASIWYLIARLESRNAL